MSRNRFVTASTARLELSDGDWIEVKERLSYGEQQRLAGAALGRMRPDGQDTEIGLNWERYNIERLLIWLIDWSFEDKKGKRVPLNRDSIAALDPATVDEIDAALSAHIDAQAAEKNAVTTGEPSPETRSA